MANRNREFRPLCLHCCERTRKAHRNFCDKCESLGEAKRAEIANREMTALSAVVYSDNEDETPKPKPVKATKKKETKGNPRRPHPPEHLSSAEKLAWHDQKRAETVSAMLARVRTRKKKGAIDISKIVHHEGGVFSYEGETYSAPGRLSVSPFGLKIVVNRARSFDIEKFKSIDDMIDSICKELKLKRPVVPKDLIGADDYHLVERTEDHSVWSFGGRHVKLPRFAKIKRMIASRSLLVVQLAAHRKPFTFRLARYESLDAMADDIWKTYNEGRN